MDSYVYFVPMQYGDVTFFEFERLNFFFSSAVNCQLLPPTTHSRTKFSF